jgi:ankyrin repeat protein
MPTNNPLNHITRLCMIALVALCVPATVCQASVEPDLSAAVRQKNAAKVQELLANGADVNERDEGAEQTPLMRAVQVKDPALVQILLAHGAAVNAQDDFGKTALMFAAEKEDADIIKLLLRKGADASVRDARALTAADIARQSRRAPLRKLFAQPRTALSQKPGKHSEERVLALK